MHSLTLRALASVGTGRSAWPRSSFVPQGQTASFLQGPSRVRLRSVKEHDAEASTPSIIYPIGTDMSTESPPAVKGRHEPRPAPSTDLRPDGWPNLGTRPLPLDHTEYSIPDPRRQVHKRYPSSRRQKRRQTATSRRRRVGFVAVWQRFRAPDAAQMALRRRGHRRAGPRTAMCVRSHPRMLRYETGRRSGRAHKRAYSTILA
jgi:hypothetical protein